MIDTSKNPAVRLGGGALVVGGLYYGAAVLSLHVALIGKSVTPVWPPTGIALVGLFVFGPRILPAITVAALLVNLPISPTITSAIEIAVGNSLAPLVAYVLLRRVKFDLKLDRLRDVLSLVFLGALGAMMVSATIGSASLYAAHVVPRSALPRTWLVWWTGDAMGVLVFAPLLLTLLRTRLGRFDRARGLEAALVLLSTAAVSVAVMRSDLPLLFIVFPFVMWSSSRFEQRGAAVSVLLVSLIAVFASVHRTGPFFGGTIARRMVILQAFNFCVVLSGFFLAALTTERRHLDEEIARSDRRRALELNDDIVQGLSIARYSLEEGDVAAARSVVERTLLAARQIVTELLGRHGGAIAPGDLVRERPADIGR